MNRLNESKVNSLISVPGLRKKVNNIKTANYCDNVMEYFKSRDFDE